MSGTNTMASSVGRAGPLLLALAFAATPLAAQEEAGGREAFLGGGIGLARGSTKVGGDSGSTFGVGFLGVFTVVKNNGFRLFSLEVEVEPFAVQNPQRDERYSSISVVAGGYLGPVGLGLGWQHRSWSGTDVWRNSDGGLAVQFMAALPLVAFGDWAISPDLFLRLAAGSEISTTGFGVRVPFGRILR